MYALRDVLELADEGGDPARELAEARRQPLDSNKSNNHTVT